MEKSRVDMTREFVQEILGKFLALVVCPEEIPGGEVTRLVIWFPNFVKEQISIGKLNEFAQIIGPENIETATSKRDDSFCIAIDFKPESEGNVSESLYEVMMAIQEIFSVRSATVFLGDEDFFKFIKGTSLNAPTRVLH